MPSGGSESPRKLATILAADIAGYSKHVGMDEEGTLARVKRQRREIMEPTVQEHRGRVVKWTGDGFFAEFDSPVEAVRCAIVIQQAMSGRNASIARPHWIQYRIGVHVGDIVIEDGDIFGDSVNVAARLEGLAEPGGIFISEGVYGLIKNKLVVGYQSLGDHKVKNITEPITVYRVLPDPHAVRSLRRRARLATMMMVAMIACAVGAGSLWMLSQSRQHTTGRTEPPVAALAAEKPPDAPPAPKEQTVAVVVPPKAPEPKREAVEPVVVAPKPPESQPAPPAAKPSLEPAMVALPGGAFMMGSSDDPSEKPPHKVTVAPFAIGEYPVTAGEWKKCVAAQACADVSQPDAEADAPAANLSWDDAVQFTSWLSHISGKTYRLPTEAEWEYAARANTSTKFWWGNDFVVGMAYCRGCGVASYDPHHPVRVGSFKANPFGLYDMGGEVSEWVSDCWHKDYHGAPSDGSFWAAGDCSSHVLRGGSWQNDPSYLSVSSRDHYDTAVRYTTHGFRLAQGGEK
ncbi:MAG: SUMF1/EgtB/PvdO family nonheme iron enzyme [Stellaceae bacterium]